MNTDEIQAYEAEREDAVKAAVRAADRIIVDRCRGNTEVLMLLTAEVAEAFAGKTVIMLRQEVWKKDMLCEVPPEILKSGM